MIETSLFNALGLLGILIIASFSTKSYYDINRKSTEIDKKLEGTYKRIDIVKNDFELKHVRKDMCNLVHEQVSRDLAEIKADLKKLLANGRTDTRHNE